MRRDHLLHAVGVHGLQPLEPRPGARQGPGRGRDVEIWNRTPDVPVAVLVDGHRVADVPQDGRIVARLGPQHSLLATLPDVTFLRRYGKTFAH